MRILRPAFSKQDFVGRLHKIELLDVLATTQSNLGGVQLARDTARSAMTLVNNRSQVQPALLARIEGLAAVPHSVQAH